MRIEVTFADRVGIAHEILAVLALRRLNVTGVEVDPPHIHIDAPGLDPATLPALGDSLRTVAGVQSVSAIDMLPGTRRRLHLDALLAALPDPVLAVDGAGRVVVANAAAASVAGLPEGRLAGTDLGTLLGDPGLTRDLIEGGFRLANREATLNGQPFLIDVTPIIDVEDTAGGPQGAVLTLFTPSRLGERLDALQNFGEGGFETILGDSPPVRGLKARASRVAAVEAPLLILGETGTGKELVAHACHRASPRADKPFLALNCAAVPENLAESELFGYAPGAFTGAQRGGKPGLLELAHGGTVFLDEIGEMSAYLQAKLLRFLNDGSFRRVGGEREQKVDVRVVSATHRALEAMVAAHAFREDLFYRLNVLTLQVPPLRERGEDILLLARHFIARACAQARRPPCRLTGAAATALLANRWPGNVRQLENVIFRAVTMSDGAFLDAPDLELAGARMAPAEDGVSAPLDEPADWEHAVEGFEGALLRRLYPRFPSSRKLAARLATSHTMIANKLRKYGIPDR
ncbi:sigma 54-interacting transcriptional regulator [Azospirillum doebereinerae]|uniref:sigma 54-interacting transcriptional regulator n=1 Tax=Azospirillum doebereinerae TaxID=92933 RepID=UPI001EE5D243|nr:sigma 54-interacting transcriptional regulator [Azospirillum doebereinerae]MCG5241217.1 sigma 54-interacting transcriptional regulator [Azospirillum doebereinerae]